MSSTIVDSFIVEHVQIMESRNDACHAVGGVSAWFVLRLELGGGGGLLSDAHGLLVDELFDPDLAASLFTC